MHAILKLENSGYCRSNTETPAQIVLPCAVWYTITAKNCTKTIKHQWKARRILQMMYPDPVDSGIDKDDEGKEGEADAEEEE